MLTSCAVVVTGELAKADAKIIIFLIVLTRILADSSAHSRGFSFAS